MQAVTRVRNFLRGWRQVWGTEQSKQALWDKEFAADHWNGLDHTKGDCVYGFIEKHCNGGAILDLGCGAGNTGVELDGTKYSVYVGVDISEVALQKAGRRCAGNHRSSKNSYVRSAIETYVPGQEFDVILFRECLFYVGAVANEIGPEPLCGLPYVGWGSNRSLVRRHCLSRYCPLDRDRL